MFQYFKPGRDVELVDPGGGLREGVGDDDQLGVGHELREVAHHGEVVAPVHDQALALLGRLGGQCGEFFIVLFSVLDCELF